MKHTILSIVLFALTVRSCAASIFVNTLESKGRTLLYEAAIDILMTCYGDPGRAVGVLGDSDGSLLKTLRSNYFIPVVLLDDTPPYSEKPVAAKRYRLQVYVIVTNSAPQLIRLFNALDNSVWWNDNAKFLIVDTAPDTKYLFQRLVTYMYITNKSALLNVQCVSLSELGRVLIFDSNPFTRNAPKAWRFLGKAQLMRHEPPMSLFAQVYKNGGKICKDLHFAKTTNIGGYPLYFLSAVNTAYLDNNDSVFKSYEPTHPMSKLREAALRHYRWFVDHIAISMNASPVITNDRTIEATIGLNPHLLSDAPLAVAEITNDIILPLHQWPLIAVTNHTGHKSQLEKILSVIDTTSQIGMGVVYFITFLFFKFFLGQSAVPALLNLVRLTCGTGLTSLPQNVAPTIYLSCLLMFVVTLQGIFTGNLAMLLTSTIPYPNVEIKRDIGRLGYRMYIRKKMTIGLSEDPALEGHIIEIGESERCIDYLLNDPLALCVMGRHEAVVYAVDWNLHLSREPMMDDYIFYVVGPYNPFKRRLESIIRAWTETGLRREDVIWEMLQHEHVQDDEVKKNVVRRIMAFGDLRFAFVILGIGLLLSLICFIGEIVICRVRLKIAKGRNRVRSRLAWVTEKKFSLFPSLNLTFNARRLLSKCRLARRR